MYDGWDELVDGYTKSLCTLPLPDRRAAGSRCYVVPPVAALRGSRAGALGYAAGVAGRVVAARRTGGRVLPTRSRTRSSVAAAAAG